MMRSELMIISCVAVSGCAAVGPNYNAPQPELRGEFLSAAATGPIEAASWWQAFGDAQLDELVEAVVRDNFDLAVARARVREARAARRVAQAGFLPSVDVRGSYQRQRISENGQLPFGGENNLFQAGLDASWEIDVFGGVRRTEEAADARLQASEWLRRDVLTSVVAEVALSYVELRGAQRQLQVVRRNVDTQSQTLELVRSKEKVGLVPELDLQQARAQLETTRAAAPPLEARIQSALFRLAVLTGQQPGALHASLGAARRLDLRGDEVPVGLPSDLLRRRPDIRTAERDLQAATADVGVATAELYPRFFLSGMASLESLSFADFFDAASGAFSIGPQIRWRLFQGGALRAQVEGSEARLEAQQARYQQSVLLAVEEVEAALVAYAQEELRRRALAESLVASQRAVDLAQVSYEKGLSEFLTVLDTERRLLEADAQLAVSETDVALHLVRLYKALGGGWEAFES